MMGLVLAIRQLLGRLMRRRPELDDDDAGVDDETVRGLGFEPTHYIVDELADWRRRRR